jgi:DNA (cytosine-5)-methyltransferase 1
VLGLKTLGSLFDGIAGFPLAAQMHGITTLWASEIEPFCIRVSSKHFPEVEQ